MNIYGYEVTNVTDDTRNVVKGSLFAAIKGDNFDGEKAAQEMLTKGAAAVITQTDLGLENQVIVENVRLAYAWAVSEFYGNPTSKLKLIAVTGTNGKTTVASLIKTAIEKLGHKCGFIGTTCYDTCGKIYQSHLSTPRQDELYRLFTEMVNNQAQYCVMEASSQALDQYRIAGETFQIGIFTNLTQDHLDWHKTMENYYQAKKMLFSMCKTALVCTDDEWGRRLVGELTIPAYTYSINDTADYCSTNIKTTSSGVSYWFTDMNNEKSYPFKFKMPGLFNVANSIAAIAAVKHLGFDVSDIIDALRDCTGVRGRCEVIYEGDFTVICDYAHTEDALMKILTCIRQFMIDGQFSQKRIICLFGAAGERDADKRPFMGATAAKYADFLVITSDNPRFENPQKIIDEVEKGCGDTQRKTFTDRRQAIAFALSLAQKDDVVLLAGKGHETYQVIGDDYQPFDERTIVNDIMEGSS
jgi:UDP-N-acetylmuramoyl-L-alanyl-D-glutamate--2,6-diaminopimelate ligase